MMLQVLDKNSVNNYPPAEDVTEKYLQKPFRDYINDPEFYKSLSKMKILAAPTGFGKTHALTAKDGFIDEMFKMDVKGVMVSIPDTGIFPKRLRRKTIRNLARNGHICQMADSLDDFLEQLDDPDVDHVLYVAHACNFKPVRIDEILAITTQVGFVADECNSWLCSHEDNYREVHGSSTTDYRKVLYNFAERLSEYTPYVFGLTATATTEQDDDYEGGRIDVKGNLEFEIINTWPSPEHILGRVAYLDKEVKFDIDNEEEVIDALSDYLSRIIYHNNTYKTKIAGAAWVGPDNVSTGYNQRWVLDKIQKLLLELNAFDDNGENNQCVILTADQQHQIVFLNNTSGRRWKFVKQDEDTILKNLRSHETPQKILIMKEKGKMGIDVPTIKSIFPLRKTEKLRSSQYTGVGITEAFLQKCGRSFRLNLTGDILKAVEENGYCLEGVIEMLDKKQRKEFYESNAIMVYAPKGNIMVEDGLRRILSKPYCLTLAQAVNHWEQKVNDLTN